MTSITPSPCRVIVSRLAASAQKQVLWILQIVLRFERGISSDHSNCEVFLSSFIKIRQADDPDTPLSRCLTPPVCSSQANMLTRCYMLIYFLSLVVFTSNASKKVVYPNEMATRMLVRGIKVSSTSAALLLACRLSRADTLDKLLSSRLLSNGVDRFQPGLTAEDVYYPSW
jgi:hypothetical protein